MSQEDIIAKRYAKGLAEYAVEMGKVDEVRSDPARGGVLIDPPGGG